MKNLENLHAIVSLEARADTDGVFTKFSNNLINLLEKLGLYRGNFKDVNIVAFRGNRAPKLAVTDYMGLHGRTVYRPISMAEGVKMHDYTKAVYDAAVIEQDVIKRIVRPFTAWIGDMLTNPHMLEKLSQPNFDFKDYEEAKAKLEKVFDAKLSQPTDNFGNLYGNMKDWSATAKIAGETSELLRTKNNLKDFLEAVEESQDLAKKLAERIEEDPVTYNISKASRTILAEISWMVAKELELYGTIVSMNNGIISAIENTAERINDSE